MSFILLIAAFVTGGALNYMVKPDTRFAGRVAAGYLYMVLLLAAGGWLLYFAPVKSPVITAVLSFIIDWGKPAGRLLLGYLAVYILLVVMRDGQQVAVYPLKKVTRLTLWAVTILTGNTFLLAAVGKATNFVEMASFFCASGYALWFLYIIMALESLGAIGVLLHFKFKTGPLAAAGLMLIMIGALYTHRHNNDPFSHSYAAVSQFITLSFMMVIYCFEEHAIAGHEHKMA
jgi:hypothetical protein